MDARPLTSSPSERRRQHDLQHYFDEAALLRSCLAYNEDDHRFATEEKGRIVYLFDANIVAFFLQPERENERRKVLAFGSDHDALDYASSTALITAEFLFSRDLAGQRGNPALICPSHGDDLTSILRDVLQEHQVEDKEIGGELQKSLAAIVERINQRRYDDIRSVADALRASVPRLADELEDVWQPLKQYRRILEEDLLRPLAMHSAATQDILAPDTAEARRWSERIRQERLKRPRASQRSDEMRDGLALVQTMMLDVAAQQEYAEALARYTEERRHCVAEPDALIEPPSPPEPVRYVMVTADQSLFDAYVRWYWNTRDDETVRFVLRLPLQYVPIINTAEMPNSVQGDQLTRKAFVALDSLFGNLSQVEPNYTQKLAQYRIMNWEIGENRSILERFYRGIDIFSLNPEAFRRVRDGWHDCYRNGTVLNAALMARRHRRELDGLVGALRSNADLRDALTKDAMENLDRIVGVHAEFTTHGNINSILKALREGADTIIPQHRVPFLVRLDRVDVPATLLRLLDGTATRADEPAIQRELREALDDAQSDRSRLLAAVIAFRRGHWIGARALAQHGLARGATPSLQSELTYLEVAAKRYILGTFQELTLRRQDVEATRAAVQALHIAALREGDSFAAARAKIEEQALALAVLRRLSYETVELDAEQPSAADIVAATVALAPILSVDSQLVSALTDQRSMVILGAGVQDWLAGALPDDVRLRHLATALAALDRPTSSLGEGAPIHNAFRLASEYLLGLRALDDTARELERLQKSEGGDPWRSRLDQADIDRLAAHFRALVSEATADADRLTAAPSVVGPIA